MLYPDDINSIDYLIIGHISIDLLSTGKRIGGTVVYASLMAKALGLRVGVVTSWGEEIPKGPLSSLQIFNYPADQSTTFELNYSDGKRSLTLIQAAPRLDFFQIPESWRNAPIVHLAPIAQEVEPTLVRNFPSALIGVTPQGWMRNWYDSGLVHPSEWPEARFVLERSNAAVISIDDVAGDENRIEELANACNILAVTEGDEGARIYWNGDVRRIRAPEAEEVDPTGAGDIFAAAFFYRLYWTRDPWEAGRFAAQLASISVSRTGLDGIPTLAEIQSCMVEVI